MKLYVQFTGGDTPEDWVEFDSSQWMSVGSGRAIYAIMGPGTPMVGYDHYAVEDQLDGSCRVTIWNDQPNDIAPVGATPVPMTPEDYYARQFIFYGLKPDIRFGGAYNNKADHVVYAATSALARLDVGQQGVIFLPWGNFKDGNKPTQSLTRDGAWVSDVQAEAHGQAQSLHSWREWTEDVPADLVQDGKLKPQRTEGLYAIPDGTKTFFLRDTTETQTIHVGGSTPTNVLAMNATAGTGQTITESIKKADDELAFAWYTPSGEPDSAAWPSPGTYRTQLDASVVGADLTFGFKIIGGSSGHWARVNAALSSDLETQTVSHVTHASPAGLKLDSHSTSWGSGGATDRFEALLAAANSNTKDNQDLEITFDTDSFMDGPWAAGDTISLDAGSLILASAAPSVTQQKLISPGAGSLVLSSVAPGVTTGFNPMPDAGSLVLSSVAPYRLPTTGVSFDGVNDFISTADPPAMGTDGKTGMFSFWIKYTGAGDGVLQFLLANDSTGEFVQLFKETDNTLRLLLSNNDGPQVQCLDLRTLRDFLGVHGWSHHLIAWDVSHTDDSKCKWYVNDVDQTDVQLYIQQSTFDVDFQFGNWGLMAKDGGGNKTQGGLQEFWLPDTGNWLDITIESNRRLFSTPEGSPKSLGSDGSGPTGSAALLYFNNPFSEFETNKGSYSQSDITLNGALTDEGTLPSYRPPVEPSAGALVLNSAAPLVVVNKIITPAAGSLVLASAAPVLVLGVGVSPQAGSLVLSAVAPTIAEQKLISATAGSLTIASAAIGVTEQKAISPAAGSLTLTSAAPTATLTIGVEPQAGSLVLSSAAVVVVHDHIIEPSAGSLVLSAVAPVVTEASANVEITPDAGSLVLAGATPSVTEQKVTEPQAGSLTLNSTAPTAFLTTTVTPQAGSLVLSSVAPPVTEQLAITPAAGSLLLSAVAPTVIEQKVVTPQAGSLTLTGAAPVLGRGVVPQAGSLVLTSAAPVVTEQKLLSPQAGSLTLTGSAPGVSIFIGSFTISPPAGSLALSSAALIVEQSLLVTPQAGSLLLSSTASTAVENTIPQIGTGKLKLTSATPIVEKGNIISSLAGALTLNSAAPLVDVDVPIEIPAGSLVLSGVAPVVLGVIAPSSGLLELTSSAPVVGHSPVFKPATGDLVLAGAAPLPGIDNKRKEVRAGALELTTPPAVSVTHNHIVVVGAGSMTISSVAPTVKFDPVFKPPANDLILLSAPPVVTLVVPGQIIVPSGQLVLSSAAPRLVVGEAGYEPWTPEAGESTPDGWTEEADASGDWTEETPLTGDWVEESAA